MARDLSCQSGLKAYKTKADAMDDNPEKRVERCDRCRWWHVAKKDRGRSRRKGTRSR